MSQLIRALKLGVAATNPADRVNMLFSKLSYAVKLAAGQTAARRRQKPFEFKVLLVGPLGSGKTAFVEQLLFEAPPDHYFPSVVDVYTGSSLVDFSTAVSNVSMKKYYLNITDTSGML